MTIKTQGGKVVTKDGKVSCECCCECGSAAPINPPSDPDFTKRLRGDEGVSAFTQVSINYSITVTVSGNPPFSSTASGVMNGSWVNAIVPDPEGEYRCADYVDGKWMEVNNVFQGNSCDFDDFCLGECGKISGPRAIGGVYLRLRSDGCLIAILSEQYNGGFFYISKECPGRISANSGISISINGVTSYIVYEEPAIPTDILAGSLDITFS
jgi:hypothetical protein